MSDYVLAQFAKLTPTAGRYLLKVRDGGDDQGQTHWMPVTGDTVRRVADIVAAADRAEAAREKAAAGTAPAVVKPVVYGVAMHAEVDTEAWQLTYGEDPAATLHEYLRHDATFVPAVLGCLPETWQADGGTVRVGHHAVLSRPGDARTRIALILDVEIHEESWRAVHGTEPDALVGPLVVAQLAALSPMRHEVDGRLEYLPASSGRLVGTSTMTRRTVTA